FGSRRLGRLAKFGWKGSEQEFVRAPGFAGFSVFAPFPVVLLQKAGEGCQQHSWAFWVGSWTISAACASSSVRRQLFLRLSNARREDVPVCRAPPRPAFPWR